MTCKDAQDALDDRLAPSTGAMSAELTAHLDSCPACRAHAASMEGIARCLADMRAFAAAIPAEVLEENKRRILAAIAAKNAKPATRFARRTPPATSRQQPAQDFSSPRIHPVLLWSAAGIAATLVMIFGIYFRDRTPVTGIPEPATPTVSVVAATHSPAKNVEPKVVSPTNEERRTRNQELPVSLAWLKEEFARLKVAREGVTWDYLNKVVKFLTIRERTLDEKVDGWQLLANAYEFAGEADRARNAFFNYLAFVEERDGKKRALDIGTNRGCVLFGSKGNALGGLAYLEQLAVRYPGTEAAPRAAFVAAEYCFKQKNWTGSEQAYRRVIEEFPDTDWANKAQQKLWLSLWVQNRMTDAIKALDDYAANRQTKEAEAYADYHVGFILQARGIGHFAEATKRLKKATTTDPNGTFGKCAQQLLASMTRKMTETEHLTN